MPLSFLTFISYLFNAKSHSLQEESSAKLQYYSRRLGRTRRDSVVAVFRIKVKVKVKVKLKVKLTIEYATQTQRERRDIYICSFFNVGAK
jgi:hypothetical protein